MRGIRCSPKCLRRQVLGRATGAAEPPIPSPRWREFRRVGQENIRRAATVAAPTLCRPNSRIADRSSLPGHRWAVWMAFTQDPGVTTRPTAHTYQVLDLGAGPLVGRLQGEVHERAVGIGLRG